MKKTDPACGFASNLIPVATFELGILALFSILGSLLHYP